MKAERPSSREFANAQKKTNLRSEDDTFKVQEEQRYTPTLPDAWLTATYQEPNALVCGPAKAYL